MPKSTFYNLNDEKREKIEKALRNEFSKNIFEKTSLKLDKLIFEKNKK